MAATQQYGLGLLVAGAGAYGLAHGLAMYRRLCAQVCGLKHIPRKPTASSNT